MTTAQSLSSSFRQFLIRDGFLFDTPPIQVESQLQTEMGEKRYIKYCKTAYSVQLGNYPIDSLYREIKTLKEASLLFSHQTDVVWRAGVWLATSLQRVANSETHFADLGCSTGYLTRWLKEINPDSQAYGFDSVDGFIRLAKSASKDVLFSKWNYFSQAKSPELKFDVLVSSLGIDFPTTGYEKEFTRPIFKNWRHICKDDGRLFAVLRIGKQSTFTNLIASAEKSGWRFDVDASSKLQMNQQERMSALAFTAVSCKATTASEALEKFWNQKPIALG
jgi:SAM-dependent methyltransferase